MKYKNLCILFAVVSLFTISQLKTAPSKDLIRSHSTIIDNTTFINANNIFMFVTNHGNFGRDLSGLFGYDYGTYYPFTTISDISMGFTSSPLYAAGFWLGGKVNGDLRVSISEYSSEFAPGPMSGGTFLPDDTSFRVYKLYSDSMNSNYADYRDWPIGWGAPVDIIGNPKLNGEQTLWTVYNDADPSRHTNMSTTPLGIEIQQTVYAGTAENPDTFLVNYYDLPVYDTSDNFNIVYDVISPSALTGDHYEIQIRDAQSFVVDTTIIDMVMYFDTTYYSYLWNFVNTTTGSLVFEDLLPGQTSPIYNGFTIALHYKFGPEFPIDSFAVTANNAGPLNPVEAAALWFQDFPVPNEADPDGNITDAQQATGNGKWAIHTGDNGGTEDGGNHGDYSAFIERVLRLDNLSDIDEYDFEIRFTGSNSNPGVGGSYAFGAFDGAPEPIYWVPFELWRTGIKTPDDPSDDVRMTIWMIDSDNSGTFNLANYGSSTTPSSSGDYEHSASAGTNDPYTDWFYWMLPSDDSPGEAGYRADTTAMNNGTYALDGEEVMARMVLINWNGGSIPPFTQDMPEVGTVFKISATDRYYPVPREDINFYFPVHDPPDTAYFAYDDNSIYMEYKLYNKGNDTISDMYIMLWFDSDLGNAGDDYVGCDTLHSIGFTYNADDNDENYYGANPPAFGFKILAGPLIQSFIPEDSALFENKYIPGYTNLPLTAFSKYIGGEDPDVPTQAYNFMQGLTRTGNPYIFAGDTLTFVNSGDPVAGVGDIDFAPADRRMSGACGPFNMNPGDSQFVKVKLAVAHGTNYLTAINVLKEVLNRDDFDIHTNIIDDRAQLPNTFTLSQNYPNPFNPQTTIKFTLPYRSKVKIDVYNILGQLVKTLVDKELTAGYQQVTWDGTNAEGKPVSTGIYLYRLRTDEDSHTKKMMLLR